MEKKFELPEAFAEKWVKALRSGEYKQGKNYLYLAGRFCCLGVAGDICGVDTVSMEMVTRFKDEEYRRDKTYLFSPLIPKGIVWNGSEGLDHILSELNDNGYSFEEIADWIEANVKFVPENLTDPETQSKNRTVLQRTF